MKSLLAGSWLIAVSFFFGQHSAARQLGPHQAVGRPPVEQPADSQQLETDSREPSRYHLRTVVLDAGHGGKDRGCAGASAREADVALDIILALGREISANCPDVRVIYTRKTDVF
ncbi:MAG: hypothetical protein EOO36_19095, partial [Cytophagaceae bacterium]